MEQSELLMSVKSKQMFVDPRSCYAAINPRDLSDLEFMALMPDIEATMGQITTSLVVWRPVDKDGNFDVNHPIWEKTYSLLTNEHVVIPEKDREKANILAQGHRRTTCAVYALANPSKYSGEMLKNLVKIPALQVSCDQATAENIALDFEKSQPLHSWNVVKIVRDLLRRDISHIEIALMMARLLFSALFSDGANKYDELVRECPDGATRKAEIKKQLRNRLDTHIYSCHLFGPAAMDQLLLWWRYVKNKLANVGDKDKLVADFDYENVQKLRQLFNNITKGGQPWTPVVRMEVVTTKPNDSNDVSYRATPGQTNVAGKWFVVEGGTAEFREALLKNMYLRQAPDERVKDDKPPTQKEREAILAVTGSGVGRANANYFHKSSTDKVGGKYLTEPRTRTEWEEWALFTESIQAKLESLVNDSQPLVKELITAIISQTAPNAGAERVATAVGTLNEALKTIKV